MSRDKQIEEMADELIDIQHNFNEYCAKPCRECELGGVVNCENYYKAKALYNAGYRKASDVAREIFEELELKAPFFCENQIAYEHFYEELAELKKKYTENKGE